MQLVCPECSTSYRIADTAIGPAGRTVKCARCGHGWHQAPDPAAAGSQPELVPEPEAEEAGPANPAEDAPQDEAPDNSPADLPEPQELAPATEGDDAPAPEPQTEPLGEEADEGGGEEAVPVETKTDDVEPSVHQHRRPPPPPKKSGRLGWAALLAIVCVLAGAGFFFRADIVKAWPPAGKFYRSVGVGMPAIELGLEISNVNYSQEQQSGKQVLLITGEISNVGIAASKIPELRVDLFDSEKRRLNHWTAPLARDMLAPGETVSFSTRMTDLPKNAKDFEVTFVLKH
jgi:predicted Zn finger-like uncharacterized protein